MPRLASHTANRVNSIWEQLEDRTVPAIVSWDGQAGDNQWGSANNWSNNKLPSASDDVIIGAGFGQINLATTASVISVQSQSELRINTGILNVSGDSAIEKLNLMSGILEGFGNIAVSKSLTWSGGTLAGNGKLVLGAVATGTISSNSGHILGRTLEVAGSLTYSGSNWSFGTSTAGTLSILTGGSFAAIGDGDIGNSGPGGAIVNAGTFTRSGFGTTTIGGSISVASSGQLNVASGTFQLNGGGSLNGSATLSSGAALEISGGSFALNSGATVGGPGSLAVSALNNGILVVSANASVANFLQTGGTLDGGATLTVTGSMEWSGGSLMGGGKLVVGATAVGTISGNTGRSLGRTLEVAGALTYSGSNWSFGTSTAGTLSIVPGGNFFAVGDGDFGNFGPGGTILNAGTFTRSGLGTTSVSGSIAVVSSGQLNVASGTFQLNGGGSLNGPAALAAGATLEVSGGSFSLNSGAAVSGLGSLAVSSANNGTLVVSANATTTNYLQTGGTLDGGAALTVTGIMEWSGGSMVGNGKLVLGTTATGTITGNSGRSLGRTLEVAGTLTYTGSNLSFGTSTAGTLSIVSGGNFFAVGDGDFSNFGPGGSIVNAGTFTRSGLGTTSVSGSIAVVSSGQLNVTSGTFQLNGGGSLNGPAALSAGATLEISGGSFSLNFGAAVSGAGSLAVSGLNNGTLVVSANATAANYLQTGGTLDGGAALTVTGNMEWLGGSMVGNGKLVLGTTAIGTITGNTGRSLGRTLEVAGILTYTGSNWSFGTSTAGTLSIVPGGNFSAIGDGDLGSSGPGGTIINSGTFTRYGLGTTTLSTGIALTNNGKLAIDAGSMFVSGALTNFNGSSLIGGTYVLTGFLQFNAAKLNTLSVPLTLIGSGSGIVDQSGLDALALFGTVTASGKLELRDGRALNVSSISNSGLVNVGAGSLLAATGSYSQDGGVTRVDGELSAQSGVTIAGGQLEGAGLVSSSVANNVGIVAPGPLTGKLTTGNYAQTNGSIKGSLAVELNGLTPGSGHDQLIVQGTVSLAGDLIPTIGYSAKVGDSFIIIDNDSNDPVSGEFDGLVNGSTVSVQGYNLQIDYAAGTGNDVALKVVATPAAAPTVGGFVINDGAAQRSVVTKLMVNFSDIVSLPLDPATAFHLSRQDNVNVALKAVQTGSSVSLSFTGGAVDGQSLADGRYTLTVISSLVNGGNFDGNGDGTPGGDYVLVGTPSNGLFRLFGDADGSGQVNTNDFLLFRLAFLSGDPTFDFDGNGQVATPDFLQFRLRFLQSV